VLLLATPPRNFPLEVEDRVSAIMRAALARANKPEGDHSEEDLDHIREAAQRHERAYSEAMNRFAQQQGVVGEPQREELLDAMEALHDAAQGEGIEVTRVT
jgi:nucleotide-binding universal stress UspA family protein